MSFNLSFLNSFLVSESRNKFIRVTIIHIFFKKVLRLLGLNLLSQFKDLISSCIKLKKLKSLEIVDSQNLFGRYVIL